MRLFSPRSWKALKSELATRLNWSNWYSLHSYSQEGEDILLRKIFDGQSNGFYVDVGAHHPFRYSNTQYFYQLGWRGMNIDGTPGSLENFRRTRHRDINIEAVVSEHPGEVEYIVFADPALNTTSTSQAESVTSHGQSVVRQRLTLATTRLDYILDRHLPAGVEIDFLSVDVEGNELAVLKSNDWHKYRPRVLVVESLGQLPLRQVLTSPLVKYIEKHQYQLWGRMLNSLYFRRYQAGPLR